MDLRVDDKIKLKGANLFGIVTHIADDGSITVKLDNGIIMKATEEHVTPIATKSTRDTHDENGKFKKGHAPFNPGKKKNQMKHCRETILEQISPFINSLGSLIEQIDEPAEKILAISRIIPYSMPKLSSVEVKESQPRNLTAEQSIARLNATYHQKPDPIEEDEEDQ